MGMRYVQLNSTWTINNDGSAVIHSAQVPPNAGIIAPGPALLFVVVDGVPSTGVDIMVGNGQMGLQQMQNVPRMPGTKAQSGATVSTNSNGQTQVDGGAVGGNSGTTTGTTGAATSSYKVTASLLLGLVATVATLVL